MAEVKPLRLLGADAGDLEVISAAVQDAVLKADNIKYDARRRRFSIELNRFEWEEVTTKRGPKTRVRAILAFDGVLNVRTRAVSKADPDLVLSLLNVTFAPDDQPPGGEVSVLFAGDGEIVLQVEALDVTLLDSAYEWATRHQPDHDKRRR